MDYDEEGRVHEIMISGEGLEDRTEERGTAVKVGQVLFSIKAAPVNSIVTGSLEIPHSTQFGIDT